ncbi:LytTR family DNA-binding domain-containing protein, partial [Pseudoalteromonas sp. Angola-31]|nr:LytTR family DNA-binding domain-containing protein [Pseudoalteromonas sp. Angola-31]
LITQLEPQGFCRIHRSHAVRLDSVESITPLASGDSEVKLTTGKVLNLSRRYKDQFKELLNSTTSHS